MQTLQELGLKQRDVAAKSGITPESLSRLERGRLTEFGARKLLAVLAALGVELDVIPEVQSGNLDDLRRERAEANAHSRMLH